MGIICASDKPLKGRYGNVPRLQQRKTASSFTEKKGVEKIPYYKSPEVGQHTLKLSPVLELQLVMTFPPELNYDLIWHYGWFQTFDNKLRPNWPGFIQYATNVTFQQKKSQYTVEFLPIIDLSLSNETCIYSTLKFVIKQAQNFAVQTPYVTFDQPLWIKAMGIIDEE